MTMNNTYKNFPLFNDVENSALRTWNRCATFFNLMSRHGKEIANGYAEQFDQQSRIQMRTMYSYIRAKGYENVKREVNRGKFNSEVH